MKLCNGKEVAVLAGTCHHTSSSLYSPKAVIQYGTNTLQSTIFSGPDTLQGTELAAVTTLSMFHFAVCRERSRIVRDDSQLLCYVYGVSGSKESKSQAKNPYQRQNPRFLRKPKMGVLASQNKMPVQPNLPILERCEMFSCAVRRRAYICRVLVLKTWCSRK